MSSNFGFVFFFNGGQWVSKRGRRFVGYTDACCRAVTSVRWSQNFSNVRYSHCSNRCWVTVRCISFSTSVNVSCNKNSVVVVLLKKKTHLRYLLLLRKLYGASQTCCARLVKVLIQLLSSLCLRSGCRMIRQVNLWVCFGFLYTLVHSSLLSRLTKQSKKRQFSILFGFSGKLMSAFCSSRWS